MKKYIYALATMLLGIMPAMAQDIATIPDNSLYVLDTTVAKGARTVLSVQMKNSAEVQSIGTYFTLPEGFTVPMEDDAYLIDLSLERTTYKKHGIGSNLVDGEYRVAILQSAGSPFKGTEGEVFTITVDVADTVEPGEYEVRLFKSELSGDSRYETDGIKGIISRNGEYKGKITVTDPTGMTEVSADGDAAGVEVYGVNGVKQPSLMKGLNIVKDAKTGKVKKISVK